VNRDLYSLATECENLAKECENEYNRLSNERLTEEKQERLLDSVMFSVGKILQIFVMLIYFALLWATDTLRLPVFNMGRYRTPGIDFLHIPLLDLQITLPGNVFLRIIQLGLPLGAAAILSGIIAIIFLRGSYSALGGFIIKCMTAVTVISFALWAAPLTIFLFWAMPMSLSVFLSFVSLFLVAIPAIPGFIMSKVSFLGEEIETENWTRLVGIVSAFFVTATSIYGIYHIWPDTIEFGERADYVQYEDYYYQLYSAGEFAEEFEYEESGEFLGFFVTTANLNFRELPTMDSRIIELVPLGTQVLALYIYPSDNAWFRVEHDGQSGFMYAEFLSPQLP